MAVATTHRLGRDQIIWAFGPDLDPVLEVEPGDTVTFETNDCFTGQIRSEDDLVTAIDLSRTNSATGPWRCAEPSLATRSSRRSWTSCPPKSASRR
jgi:acetamidase/formamidase